MVLRSDPVRVTPIKAQTQAAIEKEDTGLKAAAVRAEVTGAAMQEAATAGVAMEGNIRDNLKR